MTNNQIISSVSGRTLIDGYLLLDDEGFIDEFKQCKALNLSDDETIENLINYANNNY
jgi:hypothetical protein